MNTTRHPLLPDENGHFDGEFFDNCSKNKLINGDNEKAANSVLDLRPHSV